MLHIAVRFLTGTMEVEYWGGGVVWTFGCCFLIQRHDITFQRLPKFYAFGTFFVNGEFNLSDIEYIISVENDFELHKGFFFQ